MALSNKLQNELRKSSPPKEYNDEGHIDEEPQNSAQDDTVESASRQSQRNDFTSTEKIPNENIENTIEIEGLAKDLWSNALKGNRLFEV